MPTASREFLEPILPSGWEGDRQPEELLLPPRPIQGVDLPLIATWLAVGAIVLYLAFSSGGFDPVVHDRLGVIVWWALGVGAVLGLIPAGHLSRPAAVALGLFGGFALWTAIAVTWSISPERSVADLSELLLYLGVLALAVLCLRSRRTAVPHVLGAAAAAVAIVCLLAVLARMLPGLFSGVQHPLPLLGGEQGRLAWPLDYWNGLGALAVIGLPLLLVAAASAPRRWVGAIAAAAVPVVALCAYLTFSRGALLEAAVALIVLLAVADRRLFRLLAALIPAAGSALVIALATQRLALERGLGGASARAQGHSLLAWMAGTCVLVALTQYVLRSRGERLGYRRPRSRRWALAKALSAGVLVVVAIGVAIALGAPHALSHAWSEFKHGGPASALQAGPARYGTLSGEGRYQYWQVALQASSSHVLIGSGPGTFQLLWLPRAPFYSYVVNAHSLYLETYAEEGLVGLLLLVSFLITPLIAAIIGARRASGSMRGWLAAIAAAWSAFLVAAAIDWVWQLPVLPVLVLLLGGAVLAPSSVRLIGARSTRAEPGGPGPGAAWPARGAALLGALAALVAIAIPLSETLSLRNSQAQARRGQLSAALADARTAAAIEPYAATPALQTAELLEQRGRAVQALRYARQAIADEPANWQLWMVLARLEAETADTRAAVQAFARARALNPRSPLFAAATGQR
jgi:tetratricopeptide (TPR) repeat protein